MMLGERAQEHAEDWIFKVPGGLKRKQKTGRTNQSRSMRGPSILLPGLY